MAFIILYSLLPIVIIVCLGFAAARIGVVTETTAPALFNTAFYIMAPALFFRSMAIAGSNEFEAKPIVVYFCAIALIFLTIFILKGVNKKSVILALSSTFSNIAMIGVPIVSSVFGQAGLVTLLSLMSVHSLIILSIVTVILEFVIATAGTKVAGPSNRIDVGSLAKALFKSGISTIFHPVPLPLLCGLAYSYTGWGFSPFVDYTLKLVGMAFTPLALMLVGVNLAFDLDLKLARAGILYACIKNALHPLVFFALGKCFGLTGLGFKVMILTAALPIGANVYLYSVRYNIAQREVTASIAASTLLGLASITGTFILLRYA